MVPTIINLCYCRINETGKIHQYISVENENGILLVNPGLFVISFNNKEEIPYYELIKELGKI